MANAPTVVVAERLARSMFCSPSRSFGGPTSVALSRGSLVALRRRLSTGLPLS
jgi:hypothetical protein